MNSAIKYSGSLVEYLDRGGLHPGFVVREQGDKLVIRDRGGNERIIRVSCSCCATPVFTPKATATRSHGWQALVEEKAALRAELDLTLLWEVVQEQGRGFQRRGSGGAVLRPPARAQAPR